MKILLTGANGYIGKRLLSVLLNDGHEVICCVRDKKRLNTKPFSHLSIKVIEVNFLDKEDLKKIPEDIDAAYYLIHSMSSVHSNFGDLEKRCAENFKQQLETTSARQVIYLSGIVNAKELSSHLQSRKKVEETLASEKYHLTTLRAGIIVGSGSSSFEIIRDLVEKLPLMVAPQWLNTKSQPLSVRNVMDFLKGVLMKDFTFGKSYDIGGPEVLTYKQMLLIFAECRGLKRRIFVLPFLTPKLSSYWLYFITSTSYKLAVNLVNSMKVEVIGRPNELHKKLDIDLMTYQDAVNAAFDKIAQQQVHSSWLDAMSSDVLDEGIGKLIKVPTYGCFTDVKVKSIADKQKTIEKVWSIGGNQGWYYATWLWELRGFLDKLAGGVGLRRGRKANKEISAGDSLDFWRVIYASKSEGRLLLYAEMKLPGEAWLEFKVKGTRLKQTATFRPLGLWGRVYWYAVVPLHAFVFRGMINKLAA